MLNYCGSPSWQHIVQFLAQYLRRVWPSTWKAATGDVAFPFLLAQCNIFVLPNNLTDSKCGYMPLLCVCVCAYAFTNTFTRLVCTCVSPHCGSVCLHTCWAVLNWLGPVSMSKQPGEDWGSQMRRPPGYRGYHYPGCVAGQNGSPQAEFHQGGPPSVVRGRIPVNLLSCREERY